MPKAGKITPIAGLTAKQALFCTEYMKDFNATAAAIRSGYSKNTAHAIGHNTLQKPKIKAYIEKRLQELSLGADETIKLISDIAKGNLGDYFVTKMVEHTPRVVKPLAEIIKAIEEEIAFEREFASNFEMDATAKVTHQQAQAFRNAQLFRYRLELKRNPKATRIVDGETVLVETAVLDMAKLIADKERGRIKSISYGQYGPKVEMYAADGALRDMARVHGKFKEDNEQGAPKINLENAKITFS